MFRQIIDAAALERLRDGLAVRLADYRCALLLSDNLPRVDRYGRFALRFGGAQLLDSKVTSWPPPVNSNLMGGLPYNLKNKFESCLGIDVPARIAFPEVAFFKPEILIDVEKTPSRNRFLLKTNDADSQNIAEDCIKKASRYESLDRPHIGAFKSSFAKEEYIKAVQGIRDLIKAGDFYELNLTQEFYAEAEVNPAAIFMKMNVLRPTPFAAFFKWEDKYAISASPERFLQCNDRLLLAQPMKGTARRGQTATEDALFRRRLQRSVKERAENVMIVDLMRNDLHRVCAPGSVAVADLFQIQKFRDVFQMISSIRGRLEGENTLKAIEAAFPPGSMTGAPKVRAMERISELEPCGRGLYSGALGWLSSNGDFDFSVVIRSFIYDAKERLLSYHAGGAITWDSDPEAEYQESLLKARILKDIGEAFT